MVRVEIGPGYMPESRCKTNVCYAFRPHYLPDLDTVYLDIRPPETSYYDASWVVGDAHNLPFRHSSISEIYVAHVIEHLDNPLEFLRECRRVLKRGGRVVVETPNFLSKSAYLDPDHKHIFNFLSLWKLARKAGLKPRFGSPNIGSLLPVPLKRFFKLVWLVTADTLVLVGEKP